MKDFPAIKIALLFVLGILSEKLISIPFEHFFLLAGLLFLLLVVVRKEKQKVSYKLSTSIVAAILVIMAGNLIIQTNKREINSSLNKIYKAKNITIKGEVAKIDLKRENELVFYTITDSIISEEFFVSGKVKLLCKFRDEIENINKLNQLLKPGNKVTLNGIYYKGREKRNPGEFDYNDYLQSKGITAILLIDTISNVLISADEINFVKNTIHQVRKSIDSQIREIHSPQTAALLRGLILADRREIDYETKNNFINAGVIHVLAVSGLHVGYIVLIFFLLFGRFNLFLRSILTIVGLICFMLITGVPPSVFRATLMATILIITFLLNRSTNLINSIAIAALIILSFDPNEIYNPGFQLSFAAVLSIAIIYPVIERFISNFSIENNFIKYTILFMAVSLSAQIGTFPFTLFYFNKFSSIALFTNLIVIPAIGIIIGVAFFTLAVSVVLPFLASYFGAANDLITTLIIDIIHFSGSLDFSHIVVNQYSIVDVFVFYLFIAIFLSSLFYFKKFIPKILLTTIIAVNIFLFSSFDDEELMPDNYLIIFMIDVGQGDSFLIKFPDGKTALIDAGNTTFYFDNGERVILPLLNYLGIKNIDYAFVSHIDSDHYAGFVSLVLEKKIGAIFKPEIDTSLSKDVRFENFLNIFKIPVRYYTTKSLNIGDVKVYFLNYDEFIGSTELETNNRSGVIKITYGDRSFLFTGDLEKKAEEEYLFKYRDFLDSDVLKVSHHGSKTSTSEKFISYVKPDISLVSAGMNNSFGHPADEVLYKLKKHDSKILRTDLNRAILLRTDGKKIEIVNWNNQ
ncbi:MAG: DNA internalization-related competence protein ComEC/Rec2 [Ignavibacteria bacterium]|nr:DNA internalization-related competence protein ComEC/Rec2 [Ignavibacteria bacterium]MBT8382679.1 DNA internalization-related competence protein ComEC/Rec2 [Ignavibacteria bacterium]NNL20326.1 DNA internalization-related competence protein ComEC/Rec2 [Ignavibacteriaceae bacterium]